MRAVVLVLLAAALAPGLAACGDDGHEATPDAGDAPADADGVAGRAYLDRPDDVTGPQIHVWYVVPQDGVDRQLDVDGSIARTVGAWNSWLAAQSGGPRFRLDTAGGALDVTFARLPTEEAVITAEGAYVRERIERDLERMGVLDRSADEIHAVYYDGGSTYSCGGGPWPPKLVANVAAVYLRGTPPGSPACATNGLSADGVAMGYFEFAMIHEIFHGLGAVPTCAPNHDIRGHVGGDPTDLMYSGDQPWRPTTLDRDRDDYWGHGRSLCPDAARSAFLEPMPAGAELPPGW